MDFSRALLLAILLVIVKGSQQISLNVQSISRRTSREIRRGFREERLYYREANPRDPRNLLLLNNRPAEPLHDLYRKGFSYLHVPDFHRRPVQHRQPQRNNQSLDDIISGIIHLLGGDVHVSRPGSHTLPPPPPPSSRPTRVNNRGPTEFFARPPSLPGDAVDPFEDHDVVPTEVDDYVETSTDVVTQTHPTNRWLFPDATDVSLILGLLNGTDHSDGGEGHVHTADGTGAIEPSFTRWTYSTSSSDHGLKEVASSNTKDNLPSFAHEENSDAEVSIVPHQELDKKDHDLNVTVFTDNPPPIDSTVASHIPASFPISDPHATQSSSSTSDTLHEVFSIQSSISEVQDSTSSGSSTSHDPQTTTELSPLSPSGPITEWLPVVPALGSNLTNIHSTTFGGREPVIITQPTVFDMTVTHMMGNYDNLTKAKSPPKTETDIGSESPMPNSSVSDLPVTVITTHVDVIYGRPTVSADAPLPPPLSTGRPHVFPVDITKVRPAPSPGTYQRPRPDDIYAYGNGLRPVGAPRPGGGSGQRRPPPFRPPSIQAPEVRIDTCVVGDDSTCDVQLHEQCRTERGVSSCLCRPGFGRAVDRGLCTSVVSMVLTIKVARMGDRSIDPSLLIPGTQDYQRMNFEASHAMSTVFTYSPLAGGFRGSSVNEIYFVANRMVINSTVHLAEDEVRGSLRHHVEHAVAAAISRQSNQVGDSQLFVSGPLSALVEVDDLNECGNSELNDCSENALCENLFGTFQCTCMPGYTDKVPGSVRSSGRTCSACSPGYCNGRGKCVVVNGHQECRCRGNYGGVRCQVDNEVVGVSVGVSLIAGIVIAITAACLYLWNRRWKRAQQKSEAAKHVGYRLQTLADHVRWGSTASPLGSTCVPSESTMNLAPSQVAPIANHVYAIPTLAAQNRLHRNHLYEDDINPYGRITRTLQKPNNQSSSGMQYDSLSSECASSDEYGFPSVPSNSFIFHGPFPDRPLYR